MAKPDSVKSKAEAADEMIRQIAAQKDATNVVDITQLAKAPVAQAVVADDDEEEFPTPTINQQVAALQADLTALAREKSGQEQIIQAQAVQLETFRQMIANMQAAAPAQQATQQTNNAPPAFTQEHIDVFGQDMVDFVTDVARNIYRTEVQGLAASMQGLQQEVANTSSRAAVSAFDVFERKLDTLAPGWRALDEDPVFMEWLKARPVFGNAIAAASQNLDHDAAAEIFNTYSNLMAGTKTAKEQQQEARQLELESQIAPGRARQIPSAAKQQQQARQWSQSEITAVYRDRLKNKGSRATYTDAEFAAVEVEIAAAQREGRVDWDR